MADTPGKIIPLESIDDIPTKPPPRVIEVEKLRADFEATLAMIRTEREQSRAMIEQGQALIRDGDAGLKQCNGAEIAIRKHLAALDDPKAPQS